MPDQDVLYEIAGEAGQYARVAAAGFAPKLGRRIQRKYHIRLEAETINGLIVYYQRLYLRAAALLQEFITPSGGGYASLGDIHLENYHARLVEEFPQEEVRLLEMMENLVIQYEYLR